MLLLLYADSHPPRKKCNLFPAPHMMKMADNVTGKYEDCWDTTKQPTIYVWGINKIFSGFYRHTNRSTTCAQTYTHLSHVLRSNRFPKRSACGNVHECVYLLVCVVFSVNFCVYVSMQPSAQGQVCVSLYMCLCRCVCLCLCLCVCVCVCVCVCLCVGVWVCVRGWVCVWAEFHQVQIYISVTQP